MGLKSNRIGRTISIILGREFNNDNINKRANHIMEQ